MEKSLVIAVLAFTAVFSVTAADEGAKPDKPAVAPTSTPPSSMANARKSEMFEAQVLKVYSAEDDGAKFKAYVVKWKDAEVVVADPIGTSDKKEGDTIKIMILRMDVPNRGKMFRFMLVDFTGFPLLKKLESNEPPPKAPEAALEAKPDAVPEAKAAEPEDNPAVQEDRPANPEEKPVVQEEKVEMPEDLKE